MNEDALRERIRKDVLGRVHSGAARMRPRAYFVLRASTAILLAAFALAISASVLSFIAFSIHESGEQFLLGFGMRGVQTFLALFPWVPLGIDLMVLVALEWLLSGFRFGYRFSLLSLFAAVFGVSALLACVLYLTPFHASLLERADHGELPLFGEMYESIRDSHADTGIFRGTVLSITGDHLTIGHDDGDHDADDGTRTVVLPSGEAGSFSVGERVYVFGTSTGDMVRPYDIQQLDEDQ